MKVELNNRNHENPFEGMRHCVRLFQQAGGLLSEDLLSRAYDECKSLEQKQMFYSLLFSIGDITARAHNIFKGQKKDSGGNANRDGFATIIQWMWTNHRHQFLAFLNAGLFEEYTCFDHLLKNRIQTKGTNQPKVYNIFGDVEYRAAIVEHLYSVIKGNNPFNKMLVAKFLTLPRLTKRAGHKSMLPETQKVMRDKVEVLVELSRLMGWDYEVTPTMANFKGYRAWRKHYNGDLESVLFSTGKIKEFGKDDFLEWYEKLPAGARSRVRTRIFHSKESDKQRKWDDYLRQWILEWEAYKRAKQAEQRRLEEKVRQHQATEEDIEALARVKKEAKVTIGATGFNQLYEDICKGNLDQLKLESFLVKVNLPYNSLVIIDDSGSMTGAPFNFATFLAAVCLVKNPDDDGRNLLGFFNTSSHWHGYIDCQSKPVPNRLIRWEVAKISPTSFVDPHLSFYENYQRIDSFCRGVFQGGCTNISSIPEGLKVACEREPQVLDALKAYPVWTIVSDGEWNNMPTPEASMNNFMDKCEAYFGFRPFIVAIDVAGWRPGRVDASRFAGIDNMIYVPSNPAQIEQFLTNFKNMEKFDVYTPLQSLYRSNRYSLIRDNVLPA